MLSSELTADEKVNIEQAAKGCISGLFSEWPLLVSGLRKLGVHPPLTEPVVCHKAIFHLAWKLVLVQNENEWLHNHLDKMNAGGHQAFADFCDAMARASEAAED